MSLFPAWRAPSDRHFNLARLFVGSEGTLGLTVEATLTLVELPRAGPRSSSSSPDLLEALAATPSILDMLRPRSR